MSAELLQSWEKLKSEAPNIRIREAGKILGVSEAELLATKLGKGVSLLKPNWADFLKSTPKLGYVMALTRNEPCVHERKGEYKDVSVNGMMGLAVGEDIDLRIFLSQWKIGFYSEENRGDSVLKSFQFFDGYGEAIHKIYTTDKSNLEGWAEVKEEFTVSDAALSEEIKRNKKPEESRPLAEGSLDGFLADWGALQDTHDFFPLLRKYNVSRKAALEAAQGKFTKKVDNQLFEKLLTECRDAEQEIMIFVGNEGMIQIHTGKVSKLESMGPWFNVLDPIFNLHLRSDLIQETWIVEKPTKDGNVTSLELFGENELLILQLFGKRKPGIPQSETWANLIRKYWN
ncbi:hemin-degrading factor [Leptospira idonii]|uniref:Hemin-degrading factor n=1 Tax=Leptospira idonii TaxID=1193500 RepID=A0A4R9M2X4_9LEPT|nr:ChuX/HutX family heme-like substrate-binding protein [Leptospira idonii]TGN20245.1 hemin-degrading factor [Leptospira idonii]